MKKDVLIIAHFCSDFDGKGNNRFNYLSELFAKKIIGGSWVTSNQVFLIARKLKKDKKL